MPNWTTHLLFYMAGIATPLLLVRQLLRTRDREGACLMEVLLGMLGILSVVILVMGLGLNR